jgi:hypothetical protein
MGGHDIAERRAQARRARITPPVVLGAAVLGAAVVLHLRDPHQSGSYLFCPWLLLTGTYCPGCGGLRAVNYLTHGNVAAALSSNALFVGSLPLLVWLWTRWLSDRWRGRQRQVEGRVVLGWAVVFGVGATAFWVLRNLPGLAVLAP